MDVPVAVPVVPVVPVAPAADVLRYVQVSAGESYSYLLRSDGKVDRRTRFRRLTHRLAPNEWPKVTYVNAAAGPERTAGYMIRSDGLLDRWASATKCDVIKCPDGARYVAASRNDTQCYVLRDDGVVDRIQTYLGQTKIIPMPCPDGAKYVAVSAGEDVSYLTRDDGKIDRTKGLGKVSNVIVPKDDGVRFLGVSEQSRAADEGHPSNTHVYFVRSDGALDRSTAHIKGEVQTKNQIVPTARREGELQPGKYLSASASTPWGASTDLSYFVREDGTVDRSLIAGPSKAILSMVAPQQGERATVQAKYVQVSAQYFFCYLLRDDGLVDVTGWSTNGGKISLTMTPTEEEPDNFRCAMM